MIKSCSLRYDRTLTPEECAKNLAEAGFTHVFPIWGLEDEGLRDVLAARAHGLTVETLHAAYGGVNEIWVDDAQGEARMDFFLDCIRAASDLQVPTVIMHLSSGLTPPPISEVGLARYQRICDEAERLGVAVAFENLRYVSYLRAIFENVHSPARKFCFDCGHENLYDGGDGVLEAFGKDLVAIHLHDNLGKRDDHLPPFSGTVDWQRLCKRLKSNGIDCPITLELKANGAEADFAKHLFSCACKIESMIREDTENCG